LSPEVSMKLTDTHLNEGTPAELMYVMPQFRDALRTLDGADADPSMIQEVFEQIGELNAPNRAIACLAVERAVTFGPVATSLTITEVLHEITITLRARGTEGLNMDRYSPDGPVLRGQRDTYFPERPGPLENRATPSRTQRSWEEGMADMVRLTDASPQRGEPVSEGWWIYAGNSTWYSLGGQTINHGNGGASHTIVSYDVSELSRTPVQFHSHPRFLSESDGVLELMHVLPSRSDFGMAAHIKENARQPVQPRTLVSHSLGLTEYTHPAAPYDIRRGVVEYEVAREKFFRIFRDDRHIVNTAKALGKLAFVEEMFRYINQRLPQGFSLKFYPRGTLPEEIE
jgi:hypothetical protein